MTFFTAHVTLIVQCLKCPICLTLTAGSRVTISTSRGTVEAMTSHTSRCASPHTARVSATRVSAARPFRRAMRIAAPTILVAAILPVGVATSAHADEEINPSLSVEAATVVDLDGNPIPVSEDPGVPGGVSQNAGVAQTPAGEAGGGAGASGDLRHALGSKQSRDMKGYEPSLYRGEWFMPKKEHRRRCIMDRESNNLYRAVSAGGKYRGAYQMNRALAIGATHMMMKEVRKEMGKPGVRALKRLREIPTQQWNRYWQDRAFWTIWRKGKGSFHWRHTIPGTRC